MEYVEIGKTGIKVSRICLGTGFRGFQRRISSEQDCVETFHRAISMGCNFIDCANFYGLGDSESIVGRVLKEIGGRDKLVVTSKVGQPVGTGSLDKGLSRAHVMREVEQSLSRLKIDYLDFYLMHVPDPETTLEDALRAMDDIVTQGKARQVGISNHKTEDIIKLNQIAKSENLILPSVLQFQYSLLHRWKIEHEIFPVCQELQMGLMVYSPLAIGLLSGVIRKNGKINTDNYWYGRKEIFEIMEESEPVLQTLDEISKELSCTISELAIAWVLAKPLVTSAIIGPDYPKHVDDLFNATAIQLKQEHLERLDHIAHEVSPREFTGKDF